MTNANEPNPESAEQPATPAIESAVVTSPLLNEKGEPATAALKAALDEFWIALKRLPAYLKLVAAMSRDDKVPATAKGILAAGGIYAVSPVDLVPGIIPVAGQLDDLYVILTAVQQALRVTPDDVAQRHLEATGISPDDIQHDLASVRHLVKEAAVVTARYGVRAAKETGNRIRRFATTNMQKRGGAKRANQPL
jgi:uncharacterized membrane protein YkvA (DUF1232 family)